MVKYTPARLGGRHICAILNTARLLVSILFIRKYKVTDASVHDSRVFEDILDETNTSRDVYADSAYRSAEHEAELKALKFRAHLQRKGCRGTPLDLMGEAREPDPIQDPIQDRTCVRGDGSTSRKRYSEDNRDKGRRGEAGVAEPRIQHGQILHFDVTSRIKWRVSSRKITEKTIFPVFKP
jgi:IS5 family transposase